LSRGSIRRIGIDTPRTEPLGEPSCPQSFLLRTPACLLSALLGLGAMGVHAYRRRRQQGLKRLAAEQG